VTQQSEVKGKGSFKVLFFLTDGMMKKSSSKALEGELESLKRPCEAPES
jgi:hypothetical protein